MSLYDTGVRPLIDSYLVQESKKLRNYGDFWSASSAGYCPRLVIMRRLGVPKAPELQEDQARTTRVFEAGHVFHRWAQDITKAAGISIAQEVELEDTSLMIRGHFDDLVLVPTGRLILEFGEIVPQTSYKPGEIIEFKKTAPKQETNLILYDYKTAHSKWFEYAKSRPMSHYNRMQLGTYMYMLRKSILLEVSKHFPDKYPEVAEARILKISKDDLRLHEIQLLWSDKLEKEVLGYWTTLNKGWKAYNALGALPQCTCLDQEGGFMGKRSSKGKVYNDYFYQDKPCSQAWFEKWKENNVTPKVHTNSGV